ncbi:MAG: subunit of meta cleavage enzyme [Candidatus Binatia bacterium]
MNPYRVNRMIQRTCRRPETIARLNADPEAVFEEFGLDAGERQALREGSPAAMGRIGVHPILQMHWVMARRPEITETMSILGYEELVREE